MAVVKRLISVALSLSVGLASSGVLPPAASSAFQISDCPVGRWRLSEPELEPSLRGQMRPLVLSRASGGVEVAIEADGTADIHYQRFAMELTREEESLSLTIDGQAQGALKETDPRTLQATLNTYSVSVVMVRDGEEQSYRVESLPEMTQFIQYQCAAGLFLVLPIPFPEGNWVRLTFRRQ
jgi:hypothetical protein